MVCSAIGEAKVARSGENRRWWALRSQGMENCITFLWRPRKGKLGLYRNCSGDLGQFLSVSVPVLFIFQEVPLGMQPGSYRNGFQREWRAGFAGGKCIGRMALRYFWQNDFIAVLCKPLYVSFLSHVQPPPCSMVPSPGSLKIPVTTNTLFI